ncbi:MAG: copper amine oxidase N-terminal domain-containing protein [Caldisericia bacterium]|nr:copper amine oxidase N-terminal domain-containing protein [Caldisericia bacterium]
MVLDIPGSSSYRDKVLSFGFKYNRDYFGTNDGEIYIDEMFLGPAIKPTINGQNITVRLLSVYKDSRIIIKYKNVTAPSTEGVYTFTTKSRKESGETLADISSSPKVTVLSTAYKLVFKQVVSSITAGQWSTNTFKIERQDSSGNPVTTGTITVKLSTNSPYGKGKFSLSAGGSSITTLTIHSGSSETSPFYYYDETSGEWTITASSTGLVSATTTITVNPAAQSKFVITLPGQTFENGKGNSGTPSGQNAGSLFEVKIRACDDFNNIVTSYSGNKTLDFSGPHCCDSTNKPQYNGVEADCATTKATVSVNFTNGISDVIKVILYKAETTSIHVEDGTYTGDSSTFIVNGGPLKSFELEFPDVSTKVAGQSFPLVIKARDDYGNLTKFSGTLDISLVDGTTHLPLSSPPSPLISPSLVSFNNEISKTLQVTIYKSYDGASIKVQNHNGVEVAYSDPIDIWHGSLDHFRFSDMPPYVVYDVYFPVTIYAEDQWSNLIDDTAGATPYTGTVKLSCSLGIDKIYPTSVSFNDADPTDGKVTQLIEITFPSTSVTITARDTVLNKSGTSTPFPVYGDLEYYEFDNIAPQVSDLAFNIKILAKDMVGNLLLNETGEIDLVAEAEDGTPLTITPNNVTPTNGVWEGDVTITPANPKVRIVARNHTDSTIVGYSNWFSLSQSQPAFFIFDPIPSPQIAEQSFPVHITAVDVYGSKVINFNSAVNLSASTGPGTVSPSTIVFLNGEWNGNVTLYLPNPAVTLTVYDPISGASGVSNTFQVTGGVESFIFSSISSPQYRNENFFITISAVDVNGDIVTGFNGTVNLSSSAGTITPSTVTFTAGMWNGNVKINGEGQNVRITAMYSGKVGVSDPFTILPFSQLVFEPAISTPQYVDTPFTITVKAKTPSGSLAPWSGTVSLSCSLGNDKIDKTSLTITNGTGSTDVKIFERATSVTLTATATVYGTTISGTSNPFEVKEGNKLVFITEEQVVPIDTPSSEITVQVQDQDGNPVNVPTDTTVNLTSNSPTGRFSKDKSTWSTSNSYTVTIHSGENQVTFYYKDTSPGVHTLTASATGLRTGTQDIRISVDGSGECTITPDTAFVRETGKDFTLIFKSKASMNGGEIQIIIPTQFSEPQKTSPGGEGYVSVTSGTGVTIGTWTISGYTINIPINIMPKDRQITIKYNNVSCPDTTGDYVFDVKTRGPEGSFASIENPPKVTITQTSVSNVKVSLSPTSAGAIGEYTITFTTSPVGHLLMGSDQIIIKFPSGTEVPGVIDAASVTVNTINPTSPPAVDPNKREVTIITPVDIGDNSEVSVKFLPTAKIKNPTTTGSNYQVEVWTTNDPVKKLSAKYNITARTGVMNGRVTLDPPRANSSSNITISFKISNPLVKNAHTITLVFPSGFDIPPSIGASLITVGGSPLVDDPDVNSGTRTITMVVPRDFSSGANVEVVISKDAGIVNPPKAGKYKLTIYTSQDNQPVDTAPFDIIKESQIKEVLASVDPPTVGKIARWEITFKTGTLGGISTGGKIWVEFPNGTVVPPSIPNGTVTVDGVAAVTQRVLSLKIEITSPKDILPNSTVKIVITKDAGVKNPTSPSSTYKVKVSTTAEKTPVESAPFTIYQPPVSKLKISPDKPDGLSGYYITKPTITISASSNYDPSPKIYYHWDSGHDNLYSGPITPPEGVHKLYYHAEDRFGNVEDEHVREFKVDTKPPVISLVQPEDGSYVKDKQVKVVISSPETLLDAKINGKKMIKGTQGRWSLTVTVSEGENNFVVKARDLAGNEAEISFTVYLDTTPPEVKIVSPKTGGLVTTRSVTVIGETDPNSKVHVKVSAITGIIYEDDTFSDKNGKFQFTLTKLPPGFIGITAIATDPAGNEGKAISNFVHKETILLWIGKPEAMIDNEKTYVDPGNKNVVPFILPPGRTMVPIRFISEAFGATVGWDGATRTVTIVWGSTTIKLTIGVYTAKINDKTVKLDAPPIIREDRTFVPIRFISEAFGAQVLWDGTERKVTIIYPPSGS